MTTQNETLDIRIEYPHKPPMAWIIFDLARRGYRLSNDCATWWKAMRIKEMAV